MELADKGWIKAINLMDHNYEIAQLWVVRERIVNEVKDRWNIPEENIFSFESTTFIELLEPIKKFISDKR